MKADVYCMECGRKPEKYDLFVIIFSGEPTAVVCDECFKKSEWEEPPEKAGNQNARS